MAPVEGEPDVLMYRDLKKALVLYMCGHMNAKSVTGYSDFHYSCIDTNNIGTARPIVAMDAIRQEWDLEPGDRYYVWPKKLPCCITGDGFTASHVPQDSKYMAASFLKANAFKPHMQHCRQGGILVLLSALGDHDQRVVENMQELVRNMGDTGKIKIQIKQPGNREIHDVWCCIEYKRYNNGDWAWQHKMTHCTISPNGTFGIYQLVEFIGGEPYGVGKGEFIELFDRIHAEMKMPWELGTLQELKEQEWTGFTLLTPEIAEYMVDKLDEAIEAKGYNLDEMEFKESDKIRKQVAKDEVYHGLIYPTDYSTHGPVFDVCHAFWAWIGTMYTLLIMLMYVAWEWEIADIEWVLSFCSLDTVKWQFQYYYKNINPNRSVSNWFKLLMTGDGHKIILNDFPHVISAAAWVAKEYEEDMGEEDSIQTLLLVIFWVVCKGMRYVFWVLFTVKFEPDTDDENDPTPKVIKEMIRICKKVTYIAMNISNIMVCYIFIL